MNATRLLVVAACAVVGLCTAPLSAATYDSVAQFSSSQNPSGPWSYNSVVIGALPSTATPMIFGDHCCGGNYWTTTDPTDIYSVIGPGGVMHPGNNTDSMLGFTNPLGHPASFSISVASVDGDTNPSSDGKTLSMWRSDTLLDSQYLPGNYTGTIPWLSNVTLQSGESFYLRLNRFSNTTNFGDGQYESVTVTPVPEPSSFVLLGLGLVCLFQTARKREAAC